MRIRVKVPVYDTPLILHVGMDTKDAYQKEVLKTFPEVSPDNFASGQGKQCGSFLWIKEPRIDLLAHEVVHFADDAIDHLGIKDESGEVRAYMVGWLMGRIWPKIKDEG